MNDVPQPTLRTALPLALAFTLCVLAPRGGAQTPLSDAERARRDAEKVFNFIRFQTVRKAPADGEAKPPRPRRSTPAPPPPNAAAPAQPSAAVPASTASSAASSAPSATVATAEPVPSAAIAPSPAPTAPPIAAAPNAAPAAASGTANDEPEDADDDDEALKLVSFTAPQLSLELQATLGPSTRNVKVRFTVEADGRVTQAQAQEGTPRKLANVATQAIRQWRFAPLPRSREVDVEIAFKRD